MLSRSSGLILLCLGGTMAWSVPLGPPGTVATYALNANPADRPEFEREHKLTVVEMKLGLGPVEAVGGTEFQWVCLAFARLNSQTYEAWLLLDAWPQATRAPQVAQYLGREPDWPDAVEFVNEVTGEAALPRLSLWDYGWPQSVNGGPLAVADAAFPEGVKFQGYVFKGVEVAIGQAVTPPSQCRLVKLNPNLIIGHVGNYSRTWINQFIDRPFGRGDLWIVERDYPVWEAVWTTAWYQLAMEDGVSGIVDEDATVGDLVESYNRAFGTQIPPTVQNACAIRVAVLRGAARNFGKRWGVAFYSPTEARLKATTIPYLYDKGVSCFWVWTGWVGIGDNSGLPYSSQRYYASLVKQAQAANPRRAMNALRNAAKTCIVIPYGYTFAPYPLQYLRWLHLERGTGQGTTYRQVLTNAALEVERCLRLGIEFDIAVDDPKFTAVGYDEVVVCREDGSVTVRLPRSVDGPPLPQAGACLSL